MITLSRRTWHLCLRQRIRTGSVWTALTSPRVSCTFIPRDSQLINESVSGCDVFHSGTTAKLPPLPPPPQLRAERSVATGNHPSNDVMAVIQLDEAEEANFCLLRRSLEAHLWQETWMRARHRSAAATPTWTNESSATTETRKPADKISSCCPKHGHQPCPAAQVYLSCPELTWTSSREEKLRLILFLFSCCSSAPTNSVVYKYTNLQNSSFINETLEFTHYLHRNAAIPSSSKRLRRQNGRNLKGRRTFNVKNNWTWRKTAPNSWSSRIRVLLTSFWLYKR